MSDKKKQIKENTEHPSEYKKRGGLVFLSCPAPLETNCRDQTSPENTREGQD
jgi:hypothetical protein